MIDQLVEDNLNLIDVVLSKYHSNKYFAMDREDMYQIGSVGLVKAAQAFNKDRGSSFFSIAYRYISTEINNHLAKNNAGRRGGGKRYLFMDAPVPGAEDDITFRDLLTCSKDTEKAALTNILYKQISNKDKNNILPLLFSGFTLKEIACKKEVSTTSIYNWRIKLREDTNKLMEESQ